MNHAHTTNNTDVITTKASAAPGLITPAGISRTLVRGFNSSMSRSRYLLKAIAALLAKIIHKTTNARVFHSKPFGLCKVPNVKPNKANGIAKMVWLNLMSEK